MVGEAVVGEAVEMAGVSRMAAGSRAGNGTSRSGSGMLAIETAWVDPGTGDKYLSVSGVGLR